MIVSQQTCILRSPNTSSLNSLFGHVVPEGPLGLCPQDASWLTRILSCTAACDSSRSNHSPLQDVWDYQEDFLFSHTMAQLITTFSALWNILLRMHSTGGKHRHEKEGILLNKVEALDPDVPETVITFFSYIQQMKLTSPQFLHMFVFCLKCLLVLANTFIDLLKLL